MARLSSARRKPAAPNATATPAAAGYRMPAEWETHAGTWLAWPHELTDWPGKFEPIPWVYAEIVRQLGRAELVRILVQNERELRKVRGMLKQSGANLSAVDFFVVPTNRGWIRDFGPSFVKNAGAGGGAAMISWRFNAWAKYDDWKKDDAATSRLAPKLGLPVFEPVHKGRRVVLEGGSIDVNGTGSLLTTEECLLSRKQQRNPGFSRKDYEAVFRDNLGATNVLWLNCGIAGDDTHGHVDDLARFVDLRAVVTVVERNRNDPNYEPLRENLSRLRKMKDEIGRPLHIETLPMPEPVYFEGQRLPASYANFYIANRLLLVPTFADAADREALNTLAKLFPSRRIVPIPCRDLVLGLGTLHCMTQQQPG